MKSFDVIIIGAGPGGYVAAIRGAQLGLNIALVEKDKKPGGTCLNRGCIPTKVLLHSAALLNKFQHSASYGIKTGQIQLDLPGVLKRKNMVVRRLSNGVAGLLKQNKVNYFSGEARIQEKNRILVEDGEKKQELTGEHIIIATGSVPAPLPNLPFDGINIVSSNEAISFAEIPERLLVVGAGAVGLELALVWSRFGSKVTVIELLPNIVPGFDTELSGELKKALSAQGIKILTETTLSETELEAGSIKVKLKSKDGPVKEDSFSKVLVAIGRKAFLGGLSLDNIGIVLEKGRIKVDKTGRTEVPGVFAIGDIVEGPQLAHVASAEGITAVEAIASGSSNPTNDFAIPGCIYTDPEAASVGITELQAKERGIKIKIARFPFLASGKALIEGSQTGLVKIIADAECDQILGAHIVGPHATELIAEATLAIQLECTCEELAKTIHPHPTLSEVMGETGHAGLDGAIHFFDKKAAF